LALQQVANSPLLMDGKENRRVLRHNTIAVQVCYDVLQNSQKKT